MALEGNYAGVDSRIDQPPDSPWELMRHWMQSAVKAAVAEPSSLLLATVNEQGEASSRVVLLKSFDDAGFVFATSCLSSKGRDLDARGQAAGTLWWRETVQQVCFAGSVQRTTESESDALFSARTREAQAAATLSMQSEPLFDEAELTRAIQELAASSQSILRPETWTGYRLSPQWIEFWHGRPSRVHRRLRYDLTPSGRWDQRRLQP